MKEITIFSDDYHKDVIAKCLLTNCYKEQPLTENDSEYNFYNEDVEQELEKHRQEFLKQFEDNEDINYNWARKPQREFSSRLLDKKEKMSDIENYEIARMEGFEQWVIHHRLETRGFGYTSEELRALGLYYYRPASELIFLKYTDHSKLHCKYIKIAEQFKNALVSYIK